jgi:hypothetical protein
MAKVKKIILEVGAHELSLTIEEAKSLRDILDATFPKEPTYIPYQPIIIEKPYRPWGPWVTYTSSSTMRISSNQTGQ